MSGTTLQVIPNQDKVAKPVFNTYEEFEEFSNDFYKKIEPKLKKLREARRKSEETAWKKFY